ncbi:hypothetical protein [Saccharopolyspora gregorii]|uniref:WXG100 family type VII secretion target n=1 Tax=Saccharopolyspora gregorii TaxID=33914 RepID=A0ABP6RPW7_9PSEU
MRNPLDHVSTDFWQVTGDFDSVVKLLPPAGPGQGINPITGQLVAVRELDLARIREVARKSWADSSRTESIRTAAGAAVDSLEVTREYIGQGWRGRDFIAFSERLERLRSTIEKVLGPADRMSEALIELAGALEEALTETITTITALGSVISAVAGVAAAAFAFPDPTVSKIIALIAAVITAILAAVSAAMAIVKGIESRQKAVSGVVRECRMAIDAIK